MIRFNYFVIILGILGEFAAIYPKNAVIQDIFFGVFCMGAGMVVLTNSRKLSERMGISSEIPEDKGREKKAIITECIVMMAAALAEIVLFLLHLPYTFTTTVIAVIAVVWVSIIWRGKNNQSR